jgi:hypothetical protein
MQYMGLKCVVVVGFLCALGAAGQTVHQPVAVPQPTGAYIAFKFDWDQGQPWVRYTISVDDAGNTHFEGVGNPIESGDNDQFAEDFTMSDANRQKIFDLAKKADYFQGNLQGKQKNIAQTGQKTLVYQGRTGSGDQVIKSSAIYNYSPNNDVQELTRIFQAIATTIDFGRKLAFQYRFDKLGIDATLRSIQDMQASHYVEEMRSIEPILQKIASDPNMMHINRVTAKQLLNSPGSPGVHAQTATQP